VSKDVEDVAWVAVDGGRGRRLDFSSLRKNFGDVLLRELLDLRDFLVRKLNPAFPPCSLNDFFSLSAMIWGELVIRKCVSITVNRLQGQRIEHIFCMFFEQVMIHGLRVLGHALDPPHSAHQLQKPLLLIRLFLFQGQVVFSGASASFATCFQPPSPCLFYSSSSSSSSKPPLLLLLPLGYFCLSCCRNDAWIDSREN